MNTAISPMPRWLPATLVALLALAVMLNFVDRGAIGIAAPLMSKDLGLSATRFGLAASAFFWTYGLVQPFLGRAADGMAPARVLAVSVAVWATATVLTGMAAGLGMLIALRLLLGLGEAALFPCTSKLIALHVAPARRGLANAVVTAGLSLGPAVGTLAGGMILARQGWRMVFFAFGAATLVWLVPWVVVTARLPRAAARTAATAPSSLRIMLGQKRLWTMGAAHALANYGFFFVSIWLPLYLVKSRGLPIAQMTLFATATYATQAIAALAWGHLADVLVRRGHAFTQVLRGLGVAGQVGSIAGLTGIAMAHGPGALLAALMLTGVFLGCLPTVVYGLGQHYAGARDTAGWIGVQNAIGSLSGIVGPVVTGAIIDLTGSFTGGFAFAGAVCAAGAAVFAFALG